MTKMILLRALILLYFIADGQLAPVPGDGIIVAEQLTPFPDDRNVAAGQPNSVLHDGNAVVGQLAPPPNDETIVGGQKSAVPADVNVVCEPPQKRAKTSTEPRCKLQLSEFKFGWNPETLEPPFIELKSMCEKRRGPVPINALQNYVMIIVKSQPLSLSMVVSFENFVYDGVKPFIVIGSPDISNVDISTATPHVESVFSLVENNQMFPKDNLHAIFILQGLSKPQRKSLHLPYNLEGQKVSRMLTSDQVKLITTTAVDMLILGDSLSQNGQVFQNLWTSKSSKPHLFEGKLFQMRSMSDMSLSNCKKEYQGFNAKAFEIQPQSPGELNICSLIEEQCPSQGCASATVEHDRSAPLKLLHSITDQTVLEVRNSKFKPEYINKCQEYFPKRTKLLENEQVQKWLNFGNGDNECRFTCKACTLYRLVGFRPDVKMKPKVVTTGYFSKDIHDNGNSIKAHAKYPMHDEAMQFFEKISKSITDKEVSSIIQEFEEMEKTTFNATMNVVLIAYAELKAGVTFQGHETIMKAIRTIGANVGTKHHTGEASQSIGKIIANTFRFKMLKHLVTMNQPFSIMVDSSTSFNLPFLAVYLQVLEDEYPVTHFYSLIYMEEGEKARDMTDYFIRQIRRDDTVFPGFEKFFISKLVAFSSDGASVMVGDKTSFKVFLGDYVDRIVPNVVCLTHKLDSAYKLGIKPSSSAIAELNEDNPSDQIKLWQLTYFQSFEKSSNELYTFYASRGYKKWQHLLATAEELGIVPQRMKYVYNIRWSESHYRALQSVHHNYYAIVQDLAEIQTDSNSDATSRVTAEQHYNRMTDKTYMIVIHEFLDILTTFKTASQNFQESSSTVVGKIDILYNVIKSMQEYKNTLGSWMKDFLQHCSCGEICSEGDCSMEAYLDCTEVTINGVKLRNNFVVVLPYSELRDALYDNLVTSLKKYFDLDMMEAFQIFNPLRLNFALQPENLFFPTIEDFYTIDQTVEVHQVYENYESRITYLCKFYQIDADLCRQFQQDWIGFLTCLIQSECFNLLNSEESTRFWPLAMNTCPRRLTPLIKQMLGRIMVTPYSSSEVERGFSVMNSLKTKARSRMDKDTLDAMMTVKINGPDVTDFNAYEYTIEFLKQFARVDDSTWKGGRKPAPEKFPSMFKESRIY